MFPLNGYIVDAHVLYYTQQGKISLEVLKSKYSKLYLCPVTIIEILAKVNPDNYFDQKSVAKICLETTEILPDPPIYLAKVWGVADLCSAAIVAWKKILADFINTKSYEEFSPTAEKYKKERAKAEQNHVV